VNKLSIRNQIEKLKADSVSIVESKSVPPEAKFFIQSMLSMMDIIVSIFLEKKTQKNSGNSGLPPSKNMASNGNRNTGSGDRSGLGDPSANIRHTATGKTTTPKNCSKCRKGLTQVKVSGQDKRQLIDIVYEVVTHTVCAEIKKCPGCGHINKGAFPEGMDGKLQYGPGIKVAIIDYLVVQMMSLQRVQEHMMGIIGRSLSQAIMLKYLLQFSDSLKEWEGRQISALHLGKVIHCDETSVRIDKQTWWVHSYSSGEITLKFVHRHRGREAIEAIGIIPKYTGILIHDCWASYLSYAKVEHALCGGHLLRELKFIEQSNGYEWATKVKKILQEACKKVASRERTRVLYGKEYKTLQSRYRNALSRGLKEMPEFAEKSGKKGRTK
jgi:hypothetical protein